MTLGLPMVVSQAAGAAICGRCHWSGKSGSLGVRSGATIASGWANSTLGSWLRASRAPTAWRERPSARARQPGR